MGFLRAGKPYRFVGTNMWYGAYLGAPDTAIGNRDRLRRELDTLKSLGMDNIRLLASGQDSPLKNSLSPAFENAEGQPNEALLIGLDTVLAEMAERDMLGVLYLTNFWEWSGGMATYNLWTNGGRFINMNDPAHPWPQFPDFVSEFYENGQALARYQAWVKQIVGRTNSVTGKAYADDPTIMAWQLCNEPRPGGTDQIAKARMPAYQTWIKDSARLIKSLAPRQLVSVGHEGLKGCIEDMACFRDVHSSPDVDYTTIHIWPQNWSWADPKDLEGSFDSMAAKVRGYIAEHEGEAKAMNKPLVIEEFGFPRDGVSYDPGSTTSVRDRFYAIVLDAFANSRASQGPIAGINFWAWGGAGRAAHPDWRMRPGDQTYLGDPPHEPQGWYSVLDGDTTTIALLQQHAAAVRN